MEYPVEYMMGIMIAASAVITASGVLLAVGYSNNLLGLKSSYALLTSIIMGIGAIIIALRWFSNPTDLDKLLGTLVIGIQVILFYFPLVLLVTSMDRRRKLDHRNK